MLTDIEIAQAYKKEKIFDIAKKAHIDEEFIEPYGLYKAKLDYIALMNKLKNKEEGKLVLVTAITPTKAGEGKTTTTIGLGDALYKIGAEPMICLREPSMGPVFGIKGGATGGGAGAGVGAGSGAGASTFGGSKGAGSGSLEASGIPPPKNVLTIFLANCIGYS